MIEVAIQPSRERFYNLAEIDTKKAPAQAEGCGCL
jgi:hypothetical protein